MYCRYCGKEIPDGSVVCPSCNADLAKKGRKKVIGLLGGLILLLLIAICSLVFVNRLKNSEMNKDGENTLEVGLDQVVIPKENSKVTISEIKNNSEQSWNEWKASFILPVLDVSDEQYIEATRNLLLTSLGYTEEECKWSREAVERKNSQGVVVSHEFVRDKKIEKWAIALDGITKDGNCLISSENCIMNYMSNEGRDKTVNTLFNSYIQTRGNLFDVGSNAYSVSSYGKGCNLVSMEHYVEEGVLVEYLTDALTEEIKSIRISFDTDLEPNISDEFFVYYMGTAIGGNYSEVRDTISQMKENGVAELYSSELNASIEINQSSSVPKEEKEQTEQVTGQELLFGNTVSVALTIMSEEEYGTGVRGNIIWGAADSYLLSAQNNVNEVNMVTGEWNGVCIIGTDGSYDSKDIPEIEKEVLIISEDGTFNLKDGWGNDITGKWKIKEEESTGGDSNNKTKEIELYWADTISLLTITELDDGRVVMLRELDDELNGYYMMLEKGEKN